MIQLITLKIMIKSGIHCMFTSESCLVYFCAFVSSVKGDLYFHGGYQVWTVCVIEHNLIPHGRVTDIQAMTFNML